MEEKLVNIAYAFGLVGSIIFPLFTIFCFFLGYSYIGSTEQKLDKLKGIEVKYPIGKWVALSVCSFCLLYLAW